MTEVPLILTVCLLAVLWLATGGLPTPPPLPPLPSPKSLGYSGSANTVALWWEPTGDELACFDGLETTVGMLDNHRFLAWLHSISPFTTQAWEIGSSDTEAKYVILADTQSPRWLIARKANALALLRMATRNGDENDLKTMKGDENAK